MKAFHIEREKLYEEVWSEPITALAKKYESSDVGLIKICKKMGIPIPGRGHWSKKHPPKRPPLPINHSGPSSVAHRVLQRRWALAVAYDSRGSQCLILPEISTREEKLCLYQPM